MKPSTLLPILFMIVIGCESPSPDQWKALSGQLKNVFTLGSDSTYFFSHPQFLVTSSQNKIIVADAAQSKLLVFSNNGKYLYDIGQRGPGPGEFRDITGMWMNEENEIIVFDRNSQIFQKFNVSGKYLTSYFNEASVLTSTIEGTAINDKPILFYLPENRQQPQNYLIHLYTSDYDSITVNQLKARSLDGYTEMMRILLGIDTGSHLVIGNRIIFAPYLYNGYIYVLQLNGGKIKLIKKIRGHIFKKPLSKIDDNAKLYDLKGSLGGKSVKFLFHNESKGLFQLRNGNIVHFTYIEDRKGTSRTFGVEVYTKDMEPIGYVKLYTKVFHPSQSIRVLLKNVLWKDKNDRFYILDLTGAADVIQVVTLEFDSLETDASLNTATRRLTQRNLY